MQIETDDFCHSLQNTKIGYEYEVLYVFVPQIQLFNAEGEEETVDTLSGQGDTRPKCRLLAAGGVNVNRRTSSTPHSVALPATKIRHLGSEGVLRLRFVILQGTGTKRTGRTLSDSNAAESQICGAKPSVPLFTEGNESPLNPGRPGGWGRSFWTEYP